MIRFLMMSSFILSLPLQFAFGYDFPPTKSESINRRLQACMSQLGCKLAAPAGVCRKPGRLRPGQSPTSCHLKCMAIDISAVKCTQTGSASNVANLTKIANCLRGSNQYMVCYNGKGPCSSAHRDHLHFGANESYKCRIAGETRNKNSGFVDELLYNSYDSYQQQELFAE